MTAMGQITCGAPADAADQGPLPVHIRSSEGDVVGSGVTGSPIAVPPGRYYVTVLLPDGREIGAPDAIVVSSDSNERCVAGICQMAPPARVEATMAPPPAAIAPSMALADPTPSGNTLAASLWRGTWHDIWEHDGPHVPALPPATTLLSTASPLRIEGSTRVDQLLAFPVEGDQGPEIRLILVPYDIVTDGSDAAPTRQIMARLDLSSGSPQVTFRTTSAAANTLLDFVDMNILTNMMRVTDELVKQAEAGVNIAASSVFGAMTGVYILLRANVLAGVETWLTQIEEIDPGLPDVRILRAEMLGRCGKHHEAVELLRTLLKGRSPWFRAGLSYLLERLRLYVDVSNNPNDPFSLTPEDKANFKSVRDGLEKILPMMDNGRYIATFNVPNGPA